MTDVATDPAPSSEAVAGHAADAPLTRAQRRQLERGARRAVTFGELPHIFEMILGPERRQLGANQNALHATLLCVVEELEARDAGFRDAVKARLAAVPTTDVEEIPPTPEDLVVPSSV